MQGPILPLRGPSPPGAPSLSPQPCPSPPGPLSLSPGQVPLHQALPLSPNGPCPSPCQPPTLFPPGPTPLPAGPCPSPLGPPSLSLPGPHPSPHWAPSLSPLRASPLSPPGPVLLPQAPAPLPTRPRPLDAPADGAPGLLHGPGPGLTESALSAPTLIPCGLTRDLCESNSCAKNRDGPTLPFQARPDYNAEFRPSPGYNWRVETELW